MKGSRRRTATLILIFGAFAVLADATRPSIESSDAVVTGRVLSVEKLKVQSDEFTMWELWKAKIRVWSVAKQDTNLAETVFVYYEQDHLDEDGRHYMQACPGRPRIATGYFAKFYCLRRDISGTGKVLFVPETGWVTAP